MKPLHQRYLFLLAASPLALFPFSEWISTRQVDTELGRAIHEIALIATLIATLIVIARLAFQRTPSPSPPYFLLTLVFVPSFIGGAILGHQTRMTEMSAFAERSQPLIAAIKKYELERATPPQSLNDLVPAYLPAIPATGMMAYPRYGYQTGDDAKSEFAGNRWVLSVPTPRLAFNWDIMLYFPNQNYPVRGYGGSLMRIADWAYVHE